MNINQIKKLMERKKTSHKGENGYALVIGGSEEYVGAVVLAGLGALRVYHQRALSQSPVLTVRPRLRDTGTSHLPLCRRYLLSLHIVR